MKKIVSAGLILFVFIQFGCKKKTDMAREGIINFIAGKVNIISQGRTTAGKVGDVVTEGMSIETGAASSVDIYFNENGVKILENSLVEISMLRFSLKNEGEKTGFHLKKGRMFSKVTKKLAKNDSFTIKTSTCTAGVRGTEFLVSEDEELKSLIAILNGKVEVKNDTTPEADPVNLQDLQEVVVEKDKPMTVRELSEENRKLIKNIIIDFQEMKQDIRKKFEDQREEILKKLEEQKEENRDMIEKQKEIDRENVEKQKESDKARVDELKGISTEGKEEAMKEVDKQKEETQKLLDEVKPDVNLDNVKPDIKKFKDEVQ